MANETSNCDAAHVGSGVSAVGSGPLASPIAHKALDALRKRYDNFTLKNIGNTHRMMLVSDRRFAVTTSFNWLSFRGDPKELPRDEFGLLVSDVKLLESIYDDARRLMEDGYSHP